MRKRSAAVSPAYRVLVLSAPFLFLAWAGAATAQPEAPTRSFSGRAQVTAVDLVLTVEDAAGEVPADLGPTDFVVTEDGVPRPVVSVETLGRRLLADLPTGKAGPVSELANAPPPSTWRTVIYFDQVLSSSRSIRRAAEALAGEARRLTALGPVEIVAADPIAHRVLLPTRSS